MQLRAADLAERFFVTAVATQPDLASAHFGLAAASASLGRVADARRHLQDTLRLDPGSERARQLQKMLR
jgi:Flp pilus assembly protein TadD